MFFKCATGMSKYWVSKSRGTSWGQRQLSSKVGSAWITGIVILFPPCVCLTIELRSSVGPLFWTHQALYWLRLLHFLFLCLQCPSLHSLSMLGYQARAQKSSHQRPSLVMLYNEHSPTLTQLLPTEPFFLFITLRKGCSGLVYGLHAYFLPPLQNWKFTKTKKCWDHTGSLCLYELSLSLL